MYRWSGPQGINYVENDCSEDCEQSGAVTHYALLCSFLLWKLLSHCPYRGFLQTCYHEGASEFQGTYLTELSRRSDALVRLIKAMYTSCLCSLHFSCNCVAVNIMSVVPQKPHWDLGWISSFSGRSLLKAARLIIFSVVDRSEMPWSFVCLFKKWTTIHMCISEICEYHVFIPDFYEEGVYMVMKDLPSSIQDFSWSHVRHGRFVVPLCSFVGYCETLSRTSSSTVVLWFISFSSPDLVTHFQEPLSVLWAEELGSVVSGSLYTFNVTGLNFICLMFFSSRPVYSGLHWTPVCLKIRVLTRSHVHRLYYLHKTPITVSVVFVASVTAWSVYNCKWTYTSWYL